MPDSPPMCYKRKMQGMKRRRRKKPNRGAQEPEQQPPLQPAYPEENEREEPGQAAGQEEESQPEIVPQPQADAGAPSATPQRGRKRRRGGRGRKPAHVAPVPSNEEAAESPESASAADMEETPEPERAATPVPYTQPLPAQKRQPKGTVVLTIGLPGSGKTSWFRRRAITPLSSDLLRMMLFDDITEQRYQDLVFSTLRYLLRARMIARMPWNYVDATNLSPRERRGWIKMAQEFGYEVHAVFFDVPVEVCTERNKRRGRIVPEDVMQRMAQKLRPPTFEEGFSKITVVRVKKSAKTEADNEVQGVEDAPPSGEGEEIY